MTALLTVGECGMQRYMDGFGQAHNDARMDALVYVISAAAAVVLSSFDDQVDHAAGHSFFFF